MDSHLALGHGFYCSIANYQTKGGGVVAQCPPPNEYATDFRNKSSGVNFTDNSNEIDTIVKTILKKTQVGLHRKLFNLGCGS